MLGKCSLSKNNFFLAFKIRENLLQFPGKPPDSDLLVVRCRGAAHGLTAANLDSFKGLAPDEMLLQHHPGLEWLHLLQSDIERLFRKT